MTVGDPNAKLVNSMRAILRDGRTLQVLPVFDDIYGNPVEVVRRLTDGGLNVRYDGRVDEFNYIIDLFPPVKRDD